MVDDGVFPERAPDEADPVIDSSDGVPVFPDDHIGGSLPEMVIDLGDSPLEGSERSTSSIQPELALPEDLWGEPPEGTGAVEALDLELGPDKPVGDDWWRPTEGVDDVLDERRGPEGSDADTSLLIPSVAGPARHRRTLAPPVAIGRWSAMRRSVESLHLNRRAAAAGLAGVAAAGLLMAVGNRSSEEQGPQRQVATAGTRPVSSVPAFALPSSTTTTVAGAVPAPEPTSVPGQAPTTVVPPLSTGAPMATTRSPSPAPSATTSPPRPNATVAASSSPSPPPPTAPPATEAPATIAEPAYEEPETPPTTRRPRVTIPETTAVPNTSSTTTVPPADE